MAATKISKDGLAEIIKSTKGATIISLSWNGSDPARFKADRGRITKKSRFSGMVNARYDRKKAKAMGVAVPDVEVKPLAWREREAESAILRHKTKGTRYVEFYPASGSTEFTLDGAPCERDDVAELVKPRSKGGSSPDVGYRIIKLDGVTGAVINGAKYEVV